MLDNKIETRIKEIEKLSKDVNFWNNSERAKKLMDELRTLKYSSKSKNNSENKYINSKSIISIISGAGGVDAEDFAGILFDMYKKYCENKKWSIDILEKNVNSNKGIKGVTFIVNSKNSYNTLKNEQGIHRLVRLSPFNSNNKRQTSFVLVSIIPQISSKTLAIDKTDIRVDLSNSSGPGGMNVNKRETAVRLTHIPTNISVRVEKERSQASNMELANSILFSRLQNILDIQQKETIESLSFNRVKKIEWGNQIRSYILHPYKLIKDHRVNYEETNLNDVFSGKLDGFLEATKNL